MSCIALPPPPPPVTNMLTLSQVSLLVSRTSAFPQDDNNNVGCMALKMMSRCSAAARAPRPVAAPSGPKRCLFGAPSAADTQRLLREDRDAVKARMQRRWGWDMSREAPSAAPSTWQWEPVKARRHPYAVRPHKPAVTVTAVNTPVPTMVSPLASTPTAVLNSSTTSSSSGTSSMSPSSLPSPPHLSSPTVLRRPTTPESSWESDDSCCGDSESDSSPRPYSVPVQTRITDFWRTRRCSASDSIVKSSGSGAPSTSTPARACSVSV